MFTTISTHPLMENRTKQPIKLNCGDEKFSEALSKAAHSTLLSGVGLLLRPPNGLQVYLQQKILRVHHAPLLVGMPCGPMRWPSNSGLVLHYTTSDVEAVHKHSVFTVIFFTCAATSFPHSAKWRIWCTLDTRSYRYKLWISFPGLCLLTCVHSNHCSACWKN